MPLISIISPWVGFSDSNIVEAQHTGTGRTQSNVMIDASRCTACVTAGLLLLSAGTSATSAGCAFEPQGEGRVAAVIDARTFRLDDGREVRLAGIVPALSDRTKTA